MKLIYSGDVGFTIRDKRMSPANDEPAYTEGERPLWVCQCGGHLFELRMTGAYCIKCMEPATSWADAV